MLYTNKGIDLRMVIDEDIPFVQTR